MTFDELLESYRQEETARPPPPPQPIKPRPKLQPKQHWFWRFIRPPLKVVDVLGLLFLLGSFFTWNDVREQPASALLKQIEYAIFGFFAVYGLFLGALDDHVGRRWQWVNYFNCASGLALIGLPPADQTAVFVTMPQWTADVNARIEWG